MTEQIWTVTRKNKEKPFIIANTEGKPLAFLVMAARTDEEANEIAILIESAPQAVALCEKILRYRYGLKEYDFAKLSAEQRDVELRDSWELIEQELIGFVRGK